MANVEYELVPNKNAADMFNMVGSRKSFPGQKLNGFLGKNFGETFASEHLKYDEDIAPGKVTKLSILDVAEERYVEIGTLKCIEADPL